MTSLLPREPVVDNYERFHRCETQALRRELALWKKQACEERRESDDLRAQAAQLQAERDAERARAKQLAVVLESLGHSPEGMTDPAALQYRNLCTRPQREPLAAQREPMAVHREPVAVQREVHASSSEHRGADAGSNAYWSMRFGGRSDPERYAEDLVALTARHADEMAELHMSYTKRLGAMQSELEASRCQLEAATGGHAKEQSAYTRTFAAADSIAAVSSNRRVLHPVFAAWRHAASTWNTKLLYLQDVREEHFALELTLLRCWTAWRIQHPRMHHRRQVRHVLRYVDVHQARNLLRSVHMAWSQLAKSSTVQQMCTGALEDLDQKADLASRTRTKRIDRWICNRQSTMVLLQAWTIWVSALQTRRCDQQVTCSTLRVKEAVAAQSGAALRALSWSSTRIVSYTPFTADALSSLLIRSCFLLWSYMQPLRSGSTAQKNVVRLHDQCHRLAVQRSLGLDTFTQRALDFQCRVLAITSWRYWRWLCRQSALMRDLEGLQPLLTTLHVEEQRKLRLDAASQWLCQHEALQGLSYEPPQSEHLTTRLAQVGRRREDSSRSPTPCDVHGLQWQASAASMRVAEPYAASEVGAYPRFGGEQPAGLWAPAERPRSPRCCSPPPSRPVPQSAPPELCIRRAVCR